LGSHGVWRKRPPPPAWAWQIPTGAPLKILPKLKHKVFKKPTVPSLTVKNHPIA